MNKVTVFLSVSFFIIKMNISAHICNPNSVVVGAELTELNASLDDIRSCPPQKNKTRGAL